MNLNKKRFKRIGWIIMPFINLILLILFFIIDRSETPLSLFKAVIPSLMGASIGAFFAYFCKEFYHKKNDEDNPNNKRFNLAVKQMEDLIKNENLIKRDKEKEFSDLLKTAIKDTEENYKESIHIAPLTQSSVTYYLHSDVYKDREIWDFSKIGKDKRRRLIVIENKELVKNNNEVKNLIVFLRKISTSIIIERSTLLSNKYDFLYEDLGVFYDDSSGKYEGFFTYTSFISQEAFTKSPDARYTTKDFNFLTDTILKFNKIWNNDKIRTESDDLLIVLGLK